MDYIVGGSFINIWKCDKHPNERWDVFMPDKPICLPCEFISLRNRLDKLEDASDEALYWKNLYQFCRCAELAFHMHTCIFSRYIPEDQMTPAQQAAFDHYIKYKTGKEKKA